MSAHDRFWLKVQPTGFCWEWVGARVETGYGYFRVANGKGIRAHRFAYEALVGEIPIGLVLDHLCRNRACVNPDHLEPVTRNENTRRGRSGWNSTAKTHCPQGHEYSGANVRRTPTGSRKCRACERDCAKRSREQIRKGLGL
jgi:hypothetical protein